jgi:putative PIN family toxin of toxin-antitoxin system
MNHKLIVIDTNVLISAALTPDGTARQALNKVYQQFQIAQSDQTYQELKSRIYKHKFDKYISKSGISGRITLVFAVINICSQRVQATLSGESLGLVIKPIIPISNKTT